MPRIAAETLAARLIDLQRVRAAAAWLGQRPMLGVDVFARGHAGGLHRDRSQQLEAGYERAAQRLSGGAPPRRGQAAIPAEADDLFLGAERAANGWQGWSARMPDWSSLEWFLPQGLGEGLPRRAALSATLIAGLEMTRGGAFGS